MGMKGRRRDSGPDPNVSTPNKIWMGMKRRSYRPVPNPVRVAQAKEKSAYAWAIWCDKELDFYRHQESPLLFSTRTEADRWLHLYHHEGSNASSDPLKCDHVVQVKIVMDPAPKKKRKRRKSW